MTVLEVIQRSAGFLAKKGVDSPRLQVELLLAHALRMPRLQLYLNFERTLTETELETLRAFIKRRAGREPLQHILGSTSFCGVELAVNPRVLIPRPETELLAERARQFLHRLSDQEASSAVRNQRDACPTVLDFGTGSGCLAIVLALQCPGAKIHALDVSAAALAVARENAARHLVNERIVFFEGDGFAGLPPGARYDLIVANPPYIPAAEIEQLQPEVRDYDPRVALDGGADGLDFYRRLAAEAAACGRPGGTMMLEFGEGQAESIRELLARKHWRVESVERDDTRRERMLTARREEPLPAR